MRSLIKYTTGTFLLMALACMSSCKEDNADLSGDGRLHLTVTANDKINVVSRTLSDEIQQELQSNCRVRIFNDKDLVQKYEGVSNIPSELLLASGNYRATAYAGDSAAASFDKCYYYGEQSFEIKKGIVSSVNIACGIGNTVVAVTLADDMKSMLTDYKVTVSSADGSLTFTSDNMDKKGYFTPPTTNRDLKYVLSGTTKAGTSVETTGIIRTERSTLYQLNFKLSGSTSEPGNTGGWMKPVVSVSATSLKPTEHEFSLTQRVSFFCTGQDGTSYDLSDVMLLGKNAASSYTVQVASFTELQSLTIELPEETGITGTIDLLSATSEQLETYLSQGLEFDAQSLVGDTYRSYIVLNSSLIGKLTAIGETLSKDYKITLTAKEKATEEYSEGRTRTVEWNITVSDDKVQTIQNADYEVWAAKAVLRGKVTNEAWSKVPKLRYRVKGTADWTTVDATLSGDDFSAEVTGLTANTAYEYQALDNNVASSVTCEFTTESLFQPANAGFENTSGSSPLMFYGSGEEMWWDTGNTGSATLGKNVTSVDTSIKHGGNQSLCMKSQFVGMMGIGKFAAGNIFAGKFLKTDGMDGVLGWGRSCTSRPKALRVWVRYTPGTVDYDGDWITKGATDQGMIYVAVGDWTSSDSDYGSDWPIVVRTKESNRSLFDPKDKGTIGYGEKIFTSSVGTDASVGMTQVEIPLDYDNYGGTTRKPTHIIIVASASRYGDYYEGSTGSTMWLDDMELVYE